MSDDALLVNIQLRLRALWRYRWYAVSTAWAVALVGWLIVCLMPDVYQSRARVYIDTDSVIKPLLSGLAVNADTMNRVAMMSRVMTSPMNLERVARDTDLRRRARDDKQFALMMQALPQRIVVEGGRDNTYSITYTDSNPQMAQRVVKTLLSVFVEDTLGVKRADTDSAEDFLIGQIHDYEQRLREAEDRLADFKKANVGVMPGDAGDYYTRLQGAMQKLETIRAKYRLAEKRRDELRKQLAGEEPTFGLFSDVPTASPGSGALDSRIAELRRQLDKMLLEYTDEHPQVVALRETIAQLESQKKAGNTGGHAEAAAELAPPAADKSTLANRVLDINPVYQSIRISQSQTDVELSELKSQLDDAQAEVNGLKSKVDTIPEVEAKLARLNRDYDVNKTEYQALLQRLESARLSAKADASTEDLKFRVVEPPRVPIFPLAPNRPMLLTGVLVLALGLGTALALGLHQIRPVFFDKRTLNSVTHLPVLGVISLLPNRESQVLRSEPLRVAAALMGVLIIYGCIVTWPVDTSTLLRSALG
jgi:polysaccharide chain length determinant protein (PEP-CTERM system associated)